MAAGAAAALGSRLSSSARSSPHLPSNLTLPRAAASQEHHRRSPGAHRSAPPSPARSICAGP
eukprot:2569934-Pyramimonas_sp.AAC.1